MRRILSALILAGFLAVTGAYVFIYLFRSFETETSGGGVRPTARSYLSEQ